MFVPTAGSCLGELKSRVPQPRDWSGSSSLLMWRPSERQRTKVGAVLIWLRSRITMDIGYNINWSVYYVSVSVCMSRLVGARLRMNVPVTSSRCGPPPCQIHHQSGVGSGGGSHPRRIHRQPELRRGGGSPPRRIFRRPKVGRGGDSDPRRIRCHGEGEKTPSDLGDEVERGARAGCVGELRRGERGATRHGEARRVTGQ